MSGTTVAWRGVTITIPPAIANETAEIVEAYELAAFAKALRVPTDEVLRLKADEAAAVQAARAKGPEALAALAFPDLTPKESGHE